MATSVTDPTWIAPDEVTREQCLTASREVLAMPDIVFNEYEDLIRIQAVGMDWDIGAQIYEPEDPEQICIGADGKKVGVYPIDDDAWIDVGEWAEYRQAIERL